MNWDTNETMQWIESENEYWWLLSTSIKNELLFCCKLLSIIISINKVCGNEQINSANVNGNEIYIEFSKLIGNEQPGWFGNENGNET